MAKNVYDPYSDVKNIYTLKGLWDTANAAGDTVAKQNAANQAQQYYNNLKNNGYYDVADELSKVNYAGAKATYDKWAKNGKTKTRDYLYSLGKGYKMSQKDIDDLIGYDAQSGNVTFGGKNIGRPDAIVDGVSYWSDPSVLDSAFSDYVTRAGITRGTSNAIDRENENLFSRYSREYEDLKNTNPFDTAEAKSILAKYDLAALNGRDSQLASGSAANGGNIDSFAAANALRQQAALVNQGQQMALNAYQQKLDHARSLLSDMGVNIDRVFNENETAQNNDVARKSEISSVTGLVPNEWATVPGNKYLNSDGTVKDAYKDTDFSQIMADAKAAGNTAEYEAAALARWYKINNDRERYGQYDDGNYITPAPQRTEESRQFDEKIKAADRQLTADAALNNAKIQNALDVQAMKNQGELDVAAAKATAAAKEPEYKPLLTYPQVREALSNGVLNEELIRAYNHYMKREGENQYTMDNPPPAYKPAGSAGAGSTGDLFGENEGASSSLSGNAHVFYSGRRYTTDKAKQYQQKVNDAAERGTPLDEDQIMWYAADLKNDGNQLDAYSFLAKNGIDLNTLYS